LAGALALLGSVVYFRGNTTNDLELSPDVIAEFESFKLKHNKAYTLAEEIYRLSIFHQTLKRINEHNSNPHKTYRKGINQFSDLTLEEFETRYLMKTILEEEEDDGVYEYTTTNGVLPASVDLRTKGLVGPAVN
jgi:hypothetical protein